MVRYYAVKIRLSWCHAVGLLGGEAGGLAAAAMMVCHSRRAFVIFIAFALKNCVLGGIGATVQQFVKGEGVAA